MNLKGEIALLRTHIHILDKDEGPDPKREQKARRLFIQVAEHLSPEEAKWAQDVLSGNRETDSFELPNSYFLSIIKSRRSVRKWGQDLPGDYIYDLLMEAAILAPSGCNRQPNEYLITEDKSKIQTIAKIKKQPFIAKAPACIICLSDMRYYSVIKDKSMVDYFCYMDAGAAIQNILLTGHYIGLGMCWVNIRPRDEGKVKQLFNIGGDMKVTALIPFGVPDEIPKTPGRKSIKEMIHYENWNPHPPPSSQ